MPIVIPGDNPLLDIGTSQTATLASLAYAKEVYLQMHPQWDNSWTASDSYVDVEGSINSIVSAGNDAFNRDMFEGTQLPLLHLSSCKQEVVFQLFHSEQVSAS